MRKIYKFLPDLGLITLMVLVFNGCNDDFLDQQPTSTLAPENYLNDESHLASYAINLYNYKDGATNVPIRSAGGLSGNDYLLNTPEWQTVVPQMDDANTDNQAGPFDNNLFYAPGIWKVAESGGAWNFNLIHDCNYFLDEVLPKWKAGTITGNRENINHYIGEVYFLRAYAYFKRLMVFGDFPIIRNVLPDDREILIEASKRYPSNEVARFILSDLDSAYSLLMISSPDGLNNRLSKACAQLISSRVALYEATWLKYFNNTAFVPNGPDWPGKDKEYNANYTFPSGSIDNEIKYFLTKAMDNAKAVADAVPLTINSGNLQQTISDPVNPFYNLFTDVDLSGYDEVLLWRKYDKGLGLTHSYCRNFQNGNIAPTRGMEKGFLMANGLPFYAPGSGYQGDDSIQQVILDRDGRLKLFLKVPGQTNVIYNLDVTPLHAPVTENRPVIGDFGTYTYYSGYAVRKGYSSDGIQFQGLDVSFSGIIVFRAVEAYLNYMEACYEKNGSLDGSAQSYWQSIRTRAGVDPDFNKTIAATDMNQEALNDWGAYSGGQLIDATLFNIRRERRCELFAEGYRFNDLRRWRSMDQMITTPYHIEGIKIWGPMQYWYDPEDLTYNIGDASKCSDPALSIYYRPYECTTSNIVYSGYQWTMAHYLTPIPQHQFLITSQDGTDVTTSPIYQNPGWPIVVGQGPL